MSTFWIILLGSFLGMVLALAFLLAVWCIIEIALGDPGPWDEL